MALLRTEPDQASARAVSAIFGFSISNFTKCNGFVSLAGKASLGSMVWCSPISTSLARVYLPLEFEFRGKRGVEKGAMAAEMSSPATYLAYFIVWRVNLTKLSRNN